MKPVDDLYLQYIQSLEPIEQSKLLRLLIDSGDLPPSHLLYYAKLSQQKANSVLKQKVIDEGNIPVKRIDPAISTEGFMYMLTNKATPEDSLDYLTHKFNQDSEWATKVKNREIPNNERKANIAHLRVTHNNNNIALLQHLLDNQYTTFKELQEPTTYNKQLKHLESVIKISDRVDALERQVSDLTQFKEQQLLFNSVIVNEITNQREIVDSMVDHLIPKYSGTQEELSILQAQLSLINNVDDKIVYLLNLNIPKKHISQILGMPLRTLHRKVKLLSKKKSK